MKYSFGDVAVDPQTLIIEVAGKAKRLEPKLIDLLTYLAENPRQVLSRQQITEVVWPKVVVVDESLTQAIFALRSAINDDAKRPKYIETIPRRGYRFLPEVVFAQPEAAAPPQPANPPPDAPASSHYGFKIAVAFSALLTLALLWLILKRPQSHYEIANILPVTTMAGAECCAAINDERKMLFINVLDGAKDLYAKDLSTGSQQRLTQDDWQKGIPLWLDNSTVIYPRCSTTECQIVRQTLPQSPQAIYSTRHFIGEITLRLSNPNLLIFNEEREMSEFILFDLRSGSHEPLRNQYPDLPPHILHPIFSEDASRLYFVNIDPKPLLQVLDLKTKKIASVSNQFDEINSYSVDHRDQLMIAGVHKSTAGIWLLDSADPQPRLLVRASGDEKLQFPLADPQENALYYQSVVFDQNIAMISGNTSRSDDFSQLNSTSIDNLASFAKDEQFLYFISNRTGFSEVWRYDMASKQTKPITHMKFIGLSSVLVANDGQRFSATYVDNGQATLGVFSVHSGELLASTQVQSRPLSWSPDDKAIYAKDNQNNVSVLSSYDSQTLARTEIQRNAGLVAQQSTDGSLLFFDSARSALVERNLSTGSEQVLTTMDLESDEIRTTLVRIDDTNTRVYAVKYSKQIHELWQYPFKGPDLTPRKLLDLPRDVWITYINGDGTLVLYDKAMPPTGSIKKLTFK